MHIRLHRRRANGSLRARELPSPKSGGTAFLPWRDPRGKALATNIHHGAMAESARSKIHGKHYAAFSCPNVCKYMTPCICMSTHTPRPECMQRTCVGSPLPPTGSSDITGTNPSSFLKKIFIYLFMRDTEKEAETQAKGEAGSLWGARLGT